MKENSLSRKHIRVLSFLITAIGVLAAFTVIFFMSSQRYKREVELSRQRALSELSESIDSITIVLNKGLYSSSPETMRHLSSSLAAQSQCAKAALSEIENSDIYTDDIYRFLSQVGDCTDSITTKLSDGDEMTKTDDDNLRVLLEYSEKLSDSLSEISGEFLSGDITFEKSKSNLTLYENGETQLFSDTMTEISEAFVDYPTLVYDGPFADNAYDGDPKFTKGLDEVSATEAKSYACEILGADASQVRRCEDEKGKLYLYVFSAGTRTCGITKYGRKLCYVINEAYCGESTIGYDTACERGRAYLEKIGYKNMKSTYYSVYDGICTVCYAYEKDGVLCYPDLIKVGVCLETGEIMSLDARTYLMNHTEREIGEVGENKDEARQKLHKGLTVISEKTAVIPAAGQKEHLCYEFHCKDSANQEVLVYIDCRTGAEREILLLTYSDGGVLAQ